MTTTSRYLWACYWAICFWPPGASEAAEAGCEIVDQPSRGDFDFTEVLSRWGEKSAFAIDAQPYRVGKITINRLPIFDESNPLENRPLYRWINDIHIDTRPSVILRQLPFRAGDTIDSRLLAESERILRERSYVADARLRVLRKCENELNLEVVTREVWTLTPELSFKTVGSDSSVRTGLRDTNILGTGQQLYAYFKNDSERSSYEIAYKNPSIGNAHYSAQIGSESSTDGHRYSAALRLPFYSLDGRRAWNAVWESKTEVLTQYALGEKATGLDDASERGELAWGFSPGLRDGWTKRLMTGLRYRRDRYNATSGLPSPETLPEDRTLAYPFIELEAIEDSFALAYNISQIYRTEDLHTGKRLVAGIGYAPSGAGTLVLSGEYSDTLLFRPKHLLQARADWSGFRDTDSGKWYNGLLNLSLDYHRGLTEQRTLFMELKATKAFNPDATRQVTLGGSNGLRGFDSHYFNGNASLSFTVEERLFTDYHLFQLLRVGFAGFLDTGKVYGGPDTQKRGVYSDIGLGLRLAPSKAETGQVIHVDLAYPFGPDLRNHSLNFVIEVKKSF